MTFSKEYLDPDKYVSLTVAAEKTGYTYNYLSKLVSSGRIAKAPIEDAILVNVESLIAYTERLSPAEMNVLKVAAAYGTVAGGKKNHYGPRGGSVHGGTAGNLVERGYLEQLRDQFNVSVYCITDKGKKRVKRQS